MLDEDVSVEPEDEDDVDPETVMDPHAEPGIDDIEVAEPDGGGES